MKGIVNSLNYVPLTFFSMIMSLCTFFLLQINSFSKKIMFINGEFFSHLSRRNSGFLRRFLRNMTQLVLLPWTCTAYQIHSLSGRILNISTDGKRPYVKAKVNGY